MADLREAAQQALEALDCINSPLYVREINKVGAAMSALRTALAEPVQRAEPVVFDPAEAMRLADDYASAQSELDGEHSINRQYYVKGRDEARAELAAYLGIKERT